MTIIIKDVDFKVTVVSYAIPCHFSFTSRVKNSMISRHFIFCMQFLIEHDLKKKKIFTTGSATSATEESKQ